MRKNQKIALLCEGSDKEHIVISCLLCCDKQGSDKCGCWCLRGASDTTSSGHLSTDTLSYSRRPQQGCTLSLCHRQLPLHCQ